MRTQHHRNYLPTLSISGMNREIQTVKIENNNHYYMKKLREENGRTLNIDEIQIHN